MQKLLDYATGIQHIGIPCENLEETKAFYEGLGFRVKHEKKIHDGKPSVCFFAFQNFVLNYYEDVCAKKSGAIGHFAIDVKNIEECYKICIKQGYEVVSNGIEELPFYERGVKFFIILGVNKERVEFNEIV